jgi:hypothetical protein
MALNDSLSAARAALARGDVHAALLEVARATDALPDSLEAWLLRTQVSLSANRSEDALRSIERAGALGASPLDVSYLRGCALTTKRDHEAALAEFQRVLAHAPAHVPTRIQRARCLVELGQLEVAGVEALAIARHAPQAHRDTLPLVLRCARDLVRSGRKAAPLPLPPERPDDAATHVSFVICSVDDRRFARVSESLRAHFDGTPWELIRIPDAKSICEGYNRGLDRARGDVVVLCHDDIELVASDFRRRLVSHLARYDVIGVAGCTDLGGPSWFWSGPPHIHHWVTHYDGERRLVPGICGAHGPAVERAQALDGVFIAARRSVFQRLRFDAELLDGFHCYDIDFSYRAHRAGLNVAVALDLLIVHDTSRGEFDEQYRRYAALLCRKFPELLRRPEAKPPLFHGTTVESVDEVRALYDWIGSWCARLDAGAARA